MGDFRRHRRLWGPDVGREVDEEFAFHVEERTEELIAAGLDERAARDEAIRGFGDIERVKASCFDLARARQESMRRRERLGELRQDVVYAFRQMRAQPLLTAAALLTLMIGIGGTTSIFSVVNAVLLRPLPYTDSDRVVIVWETWRDAMRGSASPAHLRDWTEQSSTLERTAARVSRNYNVTGTGEPERVLGASVTTGWFDVLHMPPVAGRYFQPDDAKPGTRVVVLSQGFWRTRFGGDAGAVGQSITLNGEPFTIIGVAPAGYTVSYYDAQLWMPLHIPPDAQENYYDHGLFVIGKLRPGVSLEAARADLGRVTEGIRWRQPEAMQDRGVNVEPYAERLLGGYRTQLLVLLGSVLAVLLIACVNVASLLLSRATARRKELAIRAALGGGRARLLRQLLTESVVLAALGGALGVLLAALGVRTLVAAAPRGVARITEAGLQGDVLLFAVGATLVCGLLFGIAPALRATRSDLQGVLRAGGRSERSAGVRDRLRAALVVTEIAVALVLVTAAGLFIRSVQHVQRVPLGFVAENLTMARLTLPAERYPDAAAVDMAYARLLEHVRAQPGIASAAFGTRVPLWGGSMDIPLTLRDVPRDPGQEPIVHVRLISDGYFETLDIALRRGRTLRPDDLRAGTPPVVVINETLARQAFGEVEPIGQLVTGWNGPDGPVWREVVGVVADVPAFGRDQDTPPELFIPHTQAPPWAWLSFQRSIALVVRAPRDGAVSDAMRASVRTLDPALPLFDVQRMDVVVALQQSNRRFSMLLLSLLGGTGLLLAAIGIYGVVGFFVLQRTHEFGVRMALGATSGNLLRLVLAHGGRLAGAGIALGCFAALAATRVLDSMLYDVGARDPVTFITAAVVLGAAALAAAVVPARRAARVEPMRSLSGG